MLSVPKYRIWLGAACISVAAAASAEPDVARPAPNDTAAVGEDRPPMQPKTASAQAKSPDQHQASAGSREQIRLETERVFLRSPSFDPDAMLADNRRKTLCQFVCPR